MEEHTSLLGNGSSRWDKVGVHQQQLPGDGGRRELDKGVKSHGKGLWLTPTPRVILPSSLLGSHSDVGGTRLRGFALILLPFYV